MLIDTGRLIISSTFHSNEVNLEDVQPPFPSVSINNKDVLEYGGGGSFDKKKVDGQTYSFITAINLGDTIIEGDLKIQITYNNLRLVQNEKIYNGNWGFFLQTSAVKLLNNTQTIPVNKSFFLDNGQEIQVQELEVSPISTTIYYKILNGTEYDVLFQVQSSDGTMLNPVSATTATENCHIRFPKLNEEITKLIVTPYVITGKEGEGDLKDAKEKLYLYEERFEIEIK